MIRKWLAALCLGLVATAGRRRRPDRAHRTRVLVGRHAGRAAAAAGARQRRSRELEPALQYAGRGDRRASSGSRTRTTCSSTCAIAPETRPGIVPHRLPQGPQQVASRKYALNARAPGSAERPGFGPQDAIYLVMPDRFANGDPANDTVKGHGRTGSTATQAARPPRRRPQGHHAAPRLPRGHGLHAALAEPGGRERHSRRPATTAMRSPTSTRSIRASAPTRITGGCRSRRASAASG